MEIGTLYDYDQDVIKSTVVTSATPQLEKILRLTASLHPLPFSNFSIPTPFLGVFGKVIPPYRPYQEIFNTQAAKCMHKYCYTCNCVQCQGVSQEGKKFCVLHELGNKMQLGVYGGHCESLSEFSK